MAEPEKKPAEEYWHDRLRDALRLACEDYINNSGDDNYVKRRVLGELLSGMAASAGTMIFEWDKRQMKIHGTRR